MRKILLALILIITLTGCAVTGDKIRSDLNLGMTKQEVVNLLGKPDGIQKQKGYTIMAYINKPLSAWGTPPGFTDYYIYLDKTDKVVEYRTGEVRQPKQSTGVIFINPLLFK